MGCALIDYGIDIAREGGRSVLYTIESSIIMGYDSLEPCFSGAVFDEYHKNFPKLEGTQGIGP